MQRVFKQYISLVLLSLSFFSMISFVQAVEQSELAIVSCEHIKDVVNYVDDDTFVLFDLDNTVMETRQMLGSDAWAWIEGDKCIKKAGNKESGLKNFEILWFEVQKAVSMRVVEEDVKELLNVLKQKKNKVMGFTARGIPLVERTKKQLDEIGINFEEFDSDDKLIECEGGAFKYGVFFTNVGGDKGACLKTFFNSIGFWPKKVVFVDDKMFNVKMVCNMLFDKNIPCVGIHYNGGEKTHENFKKEIGDTQLYIWQQLGVILTDQQAEDMLECFKHILSN